MNSPTEFNFQPYVAELVGSSLAKEHDLNLLRAESELHEQQKAFEEKQKEYIREKAYVEQEQRELDSRLFEILSPCLNLQYKYRSLLEREKRAREIVATPIDNLDQYETIITSLEKHSNQIAEQLDHDSTDSISKLIEKEQAELDSLNSRNSILRSKIAIKKAHLAPGFISDTKSINRLNIIKNAQDSEIQFDFDENKHLLSSLDHLSSINENGQSRIDSIFDETTVLEAAFHHTQSEQEKKLNEKMTYISSLQKQLRSIELLQAQVSSLQITNSKLSFEEIEALDSIETRKSIYVDGIPLEVLRASTEKLKEISSKVDTRKSELDEKEEQIKERARQLKEAGNALIPIVEAERAKIEDVELLERRIESMKKLIDKAEDEAESLSCELYGASIYSKGEQSLLKIEQLQRDLANMSDSDDSDDFL